jgi:tetratricopeptide (TPR) repeat protein
VDYRRAWGTACKAAAGFVYCVVNENTGRREVGRRMHDLRRTAARDRVDDGTPERVVMPMYRRALVERQGLPWPPAGAETSLPWPAAVDPASLTGGLALVLVEEARYQEAEAAPRQAVADAEWRVGPNHPRSFEVVGALARVLDARGKPGEAERLQRRVLAGLEREYGADHPLVARALADLGRSMLESGRPQEAEAYLTRALSIRERRLRPGHPDTAESLAWLGEARAGEGALTEAEDRLRWALATERESLGDDHPRVALTLVHLAAVLHRVGKDADARPYAEQAVAIQEKRLRPGIQPSRTPSRSRRRSCAPWGSRSGPRRPTRGRTRSGRNGANDRWRARLVYARRSRTCT